VSKESSKLTSGGPPPPLPRCRCGCRRRVGGKETRSPTARRKTHLCRSPAAASCVTESSAGRGSVSTRVVDGGDSAAPASRSILQRISKKNQYHLWVVWQNRAQASESPAFVKQPSVRGGGVPSRADNLDAPARRCWWSRCGRGGGGGRPTVAAGSWPPRRRAAAPARGGPAATVS